MNRKITILIIIAFVQVFTLFAQSSVSLPSLEELLVDMDVSMKTTLMNNREIVVNHDGAIAPRILPYSQFTKSIKQKMVDGRLTLGMEGLYLIEDLPDSYWSSSSEERSLKIYNVLRSIRTFEGLEYYSHTSQKMKTLFLESWTIDDFESKKKIPDTIVSEILAHDTLFLYQKDNRFSKNFYTMTLRNEEQNISASIVNQTALKVSGIFEVVEEEDMQIHIVIMPYEEGMAVYVTMAAATDTKSFRKKAQQSFGNRAIALKSWFVQRIEEEF